MGGCIGGWVDGWVNMWVNGGSSLDIFTLTTSAPYGAIFQKSLSNWSNSSNWTERTIMVRLP